MDIETIDNIIKWQEHKASETLEKYMPNAFERFYRKDTSEIDSLKAELESDQREHELISEQKYFMENVLEIVHGYVAQKSEKHFKKLKKAELVEILDHLSRVVDDCQYDL